MYNPADTVFLTSCLGNVNLSYNNNNMQLLYGIGFWTHELKVTASISFDSKRFTVCSLKTDYYKSYIIKCKGKVVPVLFSPEHHAMKACWG
jgi:hypothetical protein